MMDNDSRTTLWAVIIGINYYVSDPCLRGGVQDAAMAQDYLEKRALHLDSIVLTATTPSDPGYSRPVEEPHLWPTYHNVISGLQRILNDANPGDSIYFHYSGHGARIPGQAQLGPDNTGDLALVLFENDNIGSRYLRGGLLARAFQKMVDKGLVVTLVLDCCFSGSVVRHTDWRDWDVRCIDYDINVDSASSKLPTWEHILDAASTPRSSDVEKDWLVNPDGYTILSACGPYEQAYEIDVEDQGRRGALTYFLFNTLCTLGTNDTRVTHQSLHEHLCTRFRSSWPQQTPVRYGNQNRSFFGNLVATPETALLSIYKADNDRFCLRAGEAHGICRGDEFTALPFDALDRIPEQTEPLSVLRAEIVRPFESDLIDISPATSTRQIKTGWKAKPLKSVSPQRIRIRLAKNIHERHRWKEAAQGRLFIHLATEDEAKYCIFNVRANENAEYEVVDALGHNIHGLPVVPINTIEAISEMLDILQHLATFKYFEGLVNQQPDSTFETLFSLTPNFPIGENGVYNMKHNDIWSLTIGNAHHEPLYVAILDFKPSWGIINLVSCSGSGNYHMVPPREGATNGTKNVRLRMYVPNFLQSNGKGQCEDVIKVFVMTRPISFPLMVLPEILPGADCLSQRSHNIDGLVTVISELSGQDRGQNEAMGEEWLTRNFVTRTTRG